MKKTAKRFAVRPSVVKRLNSAIDVARRLVCTPARRDAYAPIETPCTMNVMTIAPKRRPDHRCGVTSTTVCTVRVIVMRESPLGGVTIPSDRRFVDRAKNAEPKLILTE